MVLSADRPDDAGDDRDDDDADGSAHGGHVMTAFGDYDPDDAYDAADAVRDVIVNFRHRLEFLAVHIVAVDIDDDIAARLARFDDDLRTLYNRVAVLLELEPLADDESP